MASYVKRGKRWRAQVARLGVRDSDTFATKAEAVAWATQREAEIMAGTSELPAHPFRKALERYRDHESPKKRGHRWETVRLNRFLRTMAMVSKPIGELTADDFARWRDARLREVTAGSVRREMVLIRSVLELARKEWGWLKINPIQDVAKPGKPPNRDRVMSDDERDRLLLALGYDGRINLKKHEVAVGLLLALETGMRAGEVFSLEWGRVHLSERFLSLPLTKNGDSRGVPLSKRAIELLASFPGRSGRVFRVSAASADTIFRKAKKRAGIVDLHFHDSRATALTRLSKKLNVLELARMIGHRDPRSLMIYYRATATELAPRLD